MSIFHNNVVIGKFFFSFILIKKCNIGSLSGLWDNEFDKALHHFNHFVNSGLEKGFFQL